MTTGDMKWEQEPQLQTQHLKSSLVYHKGRLNIIGGTGNFANSDGLVIKSFLQLKQEGQEVRIKVKILFLDKNQSIPSNG